ncbi:lipid II:glycine glycyltransferase FemX [Bifidobacterium aerophilum]|uniref:Peptidoglycan bridge formation glycyltransferase FemA/FemB family protein n=1 Tax=Bifidobacterium aerophilum TaxID=1798155 RepID=A0A6N9Z7K0_9BIFI|nr:peptidoglycan bridge formation glycyltransferase FemA/FemB family protein [Bifidobacterium aerophilum]NEG90113.1 peptidoglycan bridge formation glycyltransferase FemA/FemB family protein [Bifidobacterium aerophilum]
MQETTEIQNQSEWNALVEERHGHPLQLWQWGELKASTGPWTAHRVVVKDDGRVIGGAQILVRDLPWPFRAISYAPRGPFADDDAQLARVADACADWCKEHVSSVSLKIDPAVESLELGGSWVKGKYIMLAKTAAIDLTPDEDTIMKGLHSKKARQYIRKAGRNGVVCRPAVEADLDAILAIYHDTAANDHFPLHPDEYYRAAFALFGDAGQLFVAEHEGRVLSFLWNITSANGTAFELWGGVNDEGKTLRANYLLKWTAILAAKEKGAVLYDLNGLLNDGISEFKMLFANEPIYWVGTFDKPLSPWYHLWNTALKIRSRIRKG